MSEQSRTRETTVSVIDPLRPLPDLLEDFRNLIPDKAAYIHDEEVRSWRMVIERIYRMANGLIALGLQPGDRVGILSRNSMAYMEVFVAILISGGCAVPLPSQATKQTLKAILNDSAVRALVISEVLKDEIVPFLEDQNSLLDDGLLGIDFSGELNGLPVHALEDWLAAHSDRAPVVIPGPDWSFNVIYSSGTTGTPKGIIHSHETRSGLVKAVMDLGLQGDGINLVSTPMYSNTTIAMWWPSFCMGCTQVLMTKFDAERALQLIQRHKISHAMFVPVQYDRMMRIPTFADYDLSSMMLKMCTSAPLRPTLKKDIVERFPGRLLESYGMTEGGASTILDGHEALKRDKLASVGPPIPGHVIKILDEAGEVLKAGEIGEIVGRSPIMSEGYHNRQDATNELLWYDRDQTLYFRTGDIGYLDEDGWLYLLDRRKDVIISGGFNIYASDLEQVLAEHPAVKDVAVIALSSRDWGETPLAVIVPSEGTDPDTGEILTWANEQLGKTQRISRIVVADQLPRNPIGKVLKRDLRDTYAHLSDVTNTLE